MKTERKCKEKITVLDNLGIIGVYKACLSCTTRGATVRKLLNCLDRLHHSEERMRFEKLFEKVISRKN